jgi:hypothetical protein
MIAMPISTKRPDWQLVLLVLIGLALLTVQAGSFRKSSKTQPEIELLGPEQNIEPEQTFGKPLTAIWIPGKLLFHLSSTEN